MGVNYFISISILKVRARVKQKLKFHTLKYEEIIALNSL